MKPVTLLSSLVLVLSVSSSQTHAMLFAYDGCTYRETLFPTGIHYYAGGSGFSGRWLGAFVANGLMRVESASPGLTYQFGTSSDYLLVTNNRFRTTEIGTTAEFGTNLEERITVASRSTRLLSTSGRAAWLSPSNFFGKIGTTNWFSFLARFESGDPSQRFGISLNLTQENNFPYEFFIGKPVGQSTWGIMGKANITAASSVDATDGRTAFLITRVIYADPDATVHMWINPQTRTQPLDAEAHVVTNVPRFEFKYLDVVSVGASEAPRTGLDEIRFGSEWFDVMPLGPQPPKFVGTPTNLAPANAATGVSLTPVVQASVFNGAGPGDFHSASQFKFISLGNVERSFTTSGLTTVQVPAGLLNYSTRYAWQVRYLGTNNPTWSDWSEPTTFTTVPGAPRLMAYDGAPYPATNILAGRAGGFGWSAAWQAQTWNTIPPGTYYFTQIAVTNPGLFYADLDVTGSRFLTTPFAWTYGDWGPTDQAPISRARRLLGLDGNMHLLNANNTFGKPGTTNWLSFLARLEDGTPDDYGIDFASNNDPNNDGLLAIGCLPESGFLGAWVPGTSPLLAAASTNQASASTAFIVVRLISNNPEDTLDLWVNPPLGPTPPATPSASLSAIPHLEFNRLGLRAAGSPAPFAALDELRFGETWESVTPIIPEPAVCIGLLALLALRRCSAHARALHCRPLTSLPRNDVP